MYVCMYVRMYVCMYVCMYVGVYVCMYVCMYVYMFVCMNVRMYLPYVCLHVCMCLYECIRMFVCIYAGTYAGTKVGVLNVPMGNDEVRGAGDTDSSGKHAKIPETSAPLAAQPPRNRSRRACTRTCSHPTVRPIFDCGCLATCKVANTQLA